VQPVEGGGRGLLGGDALSPLFLGLSGQVLTDAERAFFREAAPAGYILFKRNVATPDQVRRLTDALRDVAGRDDVPILIDQEGGRVARLGSPHWPAFPAGAAFAALYDIAPVSAIEAARHNARALALMLRDLGINVDCLPVLDVPQPGAHDIIGDRALGSDPMQVAALGSAVLRGLSEGGAVGVIKHIPGHGRAGADSHLELPVVTASAEELAVDLEPFIRLRDAPMAMTAHVVFTAFDPERCASLSPLVIGDVIRQHIGFDGLLMSDDLGMKALAGSFAERTRGVLDAGCDVVLHCSGDMAEMQQVAGAAPSRLSDAAASRLDRAMVPARRAPDGVFAEAVAARDGLLALA
jgi:beta-N-acetylhexosaminidase